MIKKLSFIQKNNQRHWVGDGFPVRSVFSYHEEAERFSPFLLLDYAGPHVFEPTDKKRGVGGHPHRGFETVTLVYSGEVEHRDSTGAGGKMGPGDVQWMTAASGIVHEEYHGRDYAKRGGPFEAIQLWVNLPRKHKMASPRYQSVTRDQIKTIDLPEGAGSVRVIAGDYNGVKGAAETFTPINLWDIQLKKDRTLELKVQSGFTTGLFVLKGKLSLTGGKTLGEGELAMMDREGETLSLEAREDSVILFLNGEPIDEPIVGYGPFVMNFQAEIKQAVLDFQSGQMGVLK